MPVTRTALEFSLRFSYELRQVICPGISMIALKTSELLSFPRFVLLQLELQKTGHLSLLRIILSEGGGEERKYREVNRARVNILIASKASLNFAKVWNLPKWKTP